MLKIYNLLPDFERFLETFSDGADFNLALKKYYLSPNKKLLGPFFNDIKKLRSGVLDLEKRFNFYKAKKRMGDLKKWGWPKRAQFIIQKVEKFYEKKFNGNLVFLFGFGGDGYARFDKGITTIYLQLDYWQADKKYFDILLAHELNHLVRDLSSKVLFSYGANRKMGHNQYIEKMTFAEHLVNEGLAGYVSSRIYPQYKPWDYLFYSKKQYQWCVKNRSLITKLVKEYVGANKDWTVFYRENLTGHKSPERLQYFCGFELIKKAAKKYPLQKLTFMPAQRIIKEFLR